MSASQIKIMEPGATSTGVNGGPAPTGGDGERLVVITGPPANIQMAVQLLYHVRAAAMIASSPYRLHSLYSALSKRSRSKSEQDQMYE